MGEVWLAQQVRPVRRQVAIKIIKAGMDTARVVARFEAERQALALMDHPAIAKVFDGGHDTGRAGRTSSWSTSVASRSRATAIGTGCRYASASSCSPGLRGRPARPPEGDHSPRSEALERPGDAGRRIGPCRKIIDFGIAKAIAQPLTERTLFTELGVLIGTPEYMSPEQADMSAIDVDTRTRRLLAGRDAVRAARRGAAVRPRRAAPGRARRDARRRFARRTRRGRARA